MMSPETFGVKSGLNIPGVAARRIQTSRRIGVTGAAVRHAELGCDRFRSVVTLHAIEHPRQRKVGQTRASGNGVVTGRAVDAELFLSLEMRDVRELDINVLAGDRDWRNQAAALGETWIFDFLGGMATAAAGRVHGSV
jgi:hypothetical protein